MSSLESSDIVRRIPIPSWGRRCPVCGKPHESGLERAVLLRSVEAAGSAVAEELRSMSARSACVVGDCRTFDVAGDTVARAVRKAGIAVHELRIPDRPDGGSPVCDDRTREALEPGVPDVDVFVAVGSGVVSDLTKWISADHGRSYLAVATAASMNGYASANVAPTIRGVKSLVRGTGPAAVYAGLDVLAAAPFRMTAAGLGDAMAKTVSSLDWRLNHLLFGDFYCQALVDLIRDIEPKYLENPEGVKAGDPEALSALFEALILTGMAMTFAGTSAPASGGEHLISHTLDMRSTVDGRPHDLHGRQVGVGTVLCAALYQEVFALERPAFRVLTEETDRDWWGVLADAVEEEHAKKRARAVQAVEILTSDAGRWEQIRRDLTPRLRDPEELRQCLRRAGAAWRIRDIDCDRDRFLNALLHAHQMRERYTILDLARTVGVLPERAEEIVDRWVM